jgi:hypothetical protein
MGKARACAAIWGVSGGKSSVLDASAYAASLDRFFVKDFHFLALNNKRTIN